MTVAIRHVVTSISDIEIVVEAGEFESPFVDYRLEPIGAVGDVCTPVQTLRLRN
jgi:hypothetical protein